VLEKKNKMPQTSLKFLVDKLRKESQLDKLDHSAQAAVPIDVEPSYESHLTVPTMDIHPVVPEANQLTKLAEDTHPAAIV
jgi:hypothetical protein